MKILLAPDSYKGALSAAEAAHAMARGLRRVWPDADLILLPIADGGEGTLDTLLAAAGGRRETVRVTGPLGGHINASYGILGDGETAVVEMAQAAGLALVPEDKRDPKRTTTRGVGELIRYVIGEPGVRRLLIGLGGSATNDGGAGILQASGVSLREDDDVDLPPGGGSLIRLRRIVREEPDWAVVAHAALDVQIACDVDNPLTGPNGASAVFGPQKGATAADVALLDAALAHYARVLGIDPHRPGLGAAGGATAGLLFLFPHATLRPGIELVLDAVRFEHHLVGVDLVLTGEGRLDSQTLAGKAIAGIATRARAAHVPVAALVGSLAPSLSLSHLATLGIHAVAPLAPGPTTLFDSIAHTAAYLESAAERIARWMELGRGFPG